MENDYDLPSPVSSQEKTFKEKVTGNCKDLVHAFTTYDGLIGNVDYAYLFTPSIPFVTRGERPPIFWGVNSRMPILLACLLGLQHALAMMGGIVATGLLFGSMANLDQETTTYLVSASLIGSGILSFVQILRVRIPFTKLYIGTGMVSVLGVSFATIPVFGSAMPVFYESGFCPTAADGTKLACPAAYGAFLATSCLCALLEVLISLTPQKIILRIFPAIVNGPVVLMIGASLVQSGMTDWAGGAACQASPAACQTSDAAHSHPWGSGQWIGLGFSVFVTIIISDKWGSPFMKSCSIIVGLLVGCIIAAATGYFQHESIDASPSGQFLWVHTFPLKLNGPIVLPLLAVYIVCAMESVGDITATSDVSRLEMEGPEFESRVQGGLLGSALGSIIGGLMTLCPLSSFAQNNGVIAMTQCAARYSGFFACMWLFLMGVIGKFSASIVAIPSAVIGGMTTFLFTSVAVSGLRIISTIRFTRRDRVVLTVSCMFGLASLLVPTWFEGVFTYKGDNAGKRGFVDAIVIVVQTPPAIAGFAGVFAHLFLPQVEDFDPTAPAIGPDETTELEGVGPMHTAPELPNKAGAV